MKTLIVFLSVFLTACQSFVPVPPPKWPDVPTELKEKCPDLNTVDINTPSFTEFLKVVVKNYELYYYCSLKQEGWSEWYNKQKENYEKARK